MVSFGAKVVALSCIIDHPGAIATVETYKPIERVDWVVFCVTLYHHFFPL